MAILRSGILGRASGKVAGVVGGHWKDKSYIREFVIPGNPDTALQQAQRTKMRYAVRFLKPLVGQVFNAYQDRFEKSMSGFNRAISENIAYCAGPVTYASIKLTLGKLFGITPLAATLAAAQVTIPWTGSDLGANGKASDAVFACIYDAEFDLWYFAADETTRDQSHIIVAVGASSQAANLHAYVWAAQYSVSSPTLLEMISNSAYHTVANA